MYSSSTPPQFHESGLLNMRGFLTRGSQTGNPKLTLSGCFNKTGCGHFHWENTRKNLWTSVAATAFGYSWQVRATSMAQETPPR